ncbi:MAG: UDP-N-acetylmuramoyl-L-alanine--D-glutamate ligase [Candidatus Daviesbacteria bacterium]
MDTNFKGKKVLILGLGINQGGLGSTRFFAKAGAKIRVTDLKTKEELKLSLDSLTDFPEIEYILGKHRYEDIDWADLIIRNPALKPDNPYVLYAKEKGKQVEMDMGIFLQFVKPSQVIGVTGTKGKSTTASMIYEILKAGGKEVIFAGNIGKSVLDTMPQVFENTLVVLEISSFQLEAFGKHQISPKYALITNIFPDHLNYYGSMKNYVQAKRIIAKYQTKNDFLFLRKGDLVTDQPEFLEGLPGNVVYFSTKDLPENFSPNLPGEHNLENFAAAFSVAKTMGVKEQTITKTLEEFKGVEYRLELIYSKNGLKIYNDTAATNPEATIQALQALPNSILICGGVNKNLSYEDLAKALEKYPKDVYFIEGDATNEILKELSAISYQSSDKIQGTYSDLEKLLADVKTVAKPGDIILFSPGAASFNLFQNEFDRGRKFNEAVEKIFG